MIKDTNVTIDLGDVEINYKDIEGLSVASGDGTTIALDLKLDENLINEGIARELVNRIQNIRKSKDLEVTDPELVSAYPDPGPPDQLGYNVNKTWTTSTT